MWKKLKTTRQSGVNKFKDPQQETNSYTINQKEIALQDFISDKLIIFVVSE